MKTLLSAHAAAEEWVDMSLTGFSGASAGSVTPFDAAGHDYTGIGIIADDRLETPILDLSSYGAPQLVYDGCLGWYNYMSHTSTYYGESDIEVSTDAGLTWTSIWQEAATANYYTVGIIEDLSAYANGASVMLGFHYAGEFAHEWGIDNVVVENVGPTGPTLALSGTCPGAITASASGMTPGGPVAIAYGLPGTTVVPSGPCTGITVDVLAPTVLAIVNADASGNAALTGNAPGGACGTILVVAVDAATCTSTVAQAL